MAISDYVHALLDLFYPRSCLHCKRNLNDSRELYICEDCNRQIPYVDEFHCIRCGSAIGHYSVLMAKEGCSVCKGKHLHFDTMTAVAHYDGVMKTLIHKFKYARQKFLFRILNNFVITHKKLQEIIPDIDVVVPVPLHWLKKMHRGSNQPKLLSRGIQRFFPKQLSPNTLWRNKNPEPRTRKFGLIDSP